MKLKSLILLMLIVVVGGAVYFYTVNQKSDNSNANLVPDLASNLNSVSKFTVKEAGNEILTSVSKTDKGWVVDNRAGYSANVKLVRAVFEALTEAKLVEAKTSNPANYSRLGVEDIQDKNAQGVLLTVTGLSEPVNIIFGNDGSSGKNTQYVRMMGEQQSWLINNKINFNRNTTEWLEEDLLDIPPERIKGIQIIHPDGTIINIANTGNAAYEFELDANAPDGKRISESEIYQVANALSSLQLKDVAPSNSLTKESAKSIRCIFKTYDGLTITTNTIASKNELVADPYFTIDVQFNAEDVDASINDVSKDSEEVTDAAMVSDPKAAEELAKNMQSKLAGWGYLFPTISKDALTKKLDYFFIDKDA